MNSNQDWQREERNSLFIQIMIDLVNGKFLCFKSFVSEKQQTVLFLKLFYLVVTVIYGCYNTYGGKI